LHPDLRARLLGLLRGDLLLDGGDLPIHLRPITQVGLVLALLPLRRTFGPPRVLTLKTLALA
jgi:hypothetical protein